jgi:hypothetical protein
MDKLATPLLDGKSPQPALHKGAAALGALALFLSGLVLGRMSAAPQSAVEPFMAQHELPVATALAASAGPAPVAAVPATAEVAKPTELFTFSLDYLEKSVASAAPVSNDCAHDYTVLPKEKPKTFDCPAFVIKSTDDTWHRRDWKMSSWAIDTYFIEDWQSVRAWGTHIQGREGLRQFMMDWLGGFPDVFIRVADLFCDGNDEDGYKTTMPYVLTATHTGWSKAWGEPTGQKVHYHGIANCFVKKNSTGGWQYTYEWDVGDTASFFTVLNRSMVPHPADDLIPTEDCTPLFDWGSGKMNWNAKSTWGAYR